MQESHFRSLVKGVSWRIGGTLATAAIAFFFTHNTKAALQIGGVDFIFKIFLYYLHERAWMMVAFGRKPEVDYEI